MKIVPASYEIIESKLLRMSMEERIEYCGRLCYKSEAKIDKDSAIPFCKKMIDSGHLAVMEMDRVHLVVDNEIGRLIAESCNKYIMVDRIDMNAVAVSGSPRAFIEYRGACAAFIRSFLSKAHPEIFTNEFDFSLSHLFYDHIITYAYPDQIPTDHRYIAVKFIVNRAVTHELVRHRPCSFLQESQRYCRYSDDKFGNEVTFIAPTAFWKTIVNIDDENEESNIWLESMKFAEQQYFRLLKTSSPQAARTVLPNSCKTEIIVYASVKEWKHIFSLRVPPSAEPSMREVMIPLEKEMLTLGIIR